MGGGEGRWCFSGGQTLVVSLQERPSPQGPGPSLRPNPQQMEVPGAL